MTHRIRQCLTMESIEIAQNLHQNTVAEDCCSFCSRCEFDHVEDYSISLPKGSTFKAHRECVDTATDLVNSIINGRVPSDRILEEFVNTRDAFCAWCDRPGATILCRNVSSCKSKFHPPCKRDASASADDRLCPMCSARIENSDVQIRGS